MTGVKKTLLLLALFLAPAPSFAWRSLRVSGGGGAAATSPGSPQGSFQMNSGGLFAGTSFYYDGTANNYKTGLGTASPSANWHVFQSNVPTGTILEWDTFSPNAYVNFVKFRFAGTDSFREGYRPQGIGSGGTLDYAGFVWKNSATEGNEPVKFDTTNDRYNFGVGSRYGTGKINVAGGSIIGQPFLYSTYTAPTDGLLVYGDYKSSGTLTVGTGSHQITTAAGLVDGTQVGSGVAAANIASGSLGGQVIASSIAVSGVTAGTYGSATQVSSVTVGADGRVTSAANVAIAITGNAISGGTFGAVNGSALTNLTAANIAAGNLGALVKASSVAASAIQTAVTAGSNVTITNTANGVQVAASASGSGDNLGNHIATQAVSMAGYGITDLGVTSSTNTLSFAGGTVSGTVDMSTNPATNLQYIQWADSGAGFRTYASSTVYLASDSTIGTSTWTIPGVAWTLSANSTYTITGTLVIASPSSNASGFKLTCAGPTAVSFRLACLGGTTAASTGNFAMTTATLGTLTGTAMAAATSQTWFIPFVIDIVTGAGGGIFNLQAVNMGGGTYTFRSMVTQATATKSP